MINDSAKTVQDWISEWESAYLAFCKENNFEDTPRNRYCYYKGALSTLNKAQKKKELENSIALMGAIEYIEALVQTNRVSFWRRNVKKS